MLTILVFLATLSFFLFALRKGKGHDLPPGPLGLPFLGNLLQMGRMPHSKFCDWAEKYGKLYTIYIGRKATLVVNDQKLIKELFGLPAATGRLKNDFLNILSNGSCGLSNAEGGAWQEQKRFCLRALRQFGFGWGPRMEPIIISQAEQAISEVVKQNVNLKEVISHSVSNVLWTMITGKRLKAEDARFVEVLNEWVECLQLATNSGLIFFPWIKYLAPRQSGYEKYVEICNEIRHYVENDFKAHQNTRIKGEPARDMIDAFINKVENCEDEGSSFFGDTGWKHSFASVVTLLVAGGESTGTMLNWIIMYLSAYPEIQRELQEEIDLVIGPCGDPSLSDKVKMVYTEAVILEVLRISTLVPFGFMHELLADVNFHGYRLPKGTLLIANLHHVHHDKAIWGDPEMFRPSRFLEVGGENLKEFVVSFQPGKRTCPGERLAKDIMFLFLVKLCQSYTFSMGDSSGGNVAEFLAPECGFALLPSKKHRVVAVARNYAMNENNNNMTTKVDDFFKRDLN